MELQFDTTKCPYLKQIVGQAQKQEQTQEIRLMDGMPDIGKILGCWGQIVIRSKEWRQDEIGASGGVKVWVLYTGESDDVHCLDGWIPFQMRWPIPNSQRDGQIQLQPYIQELECRGIGARKMMVRASVCVYANAYEQSFEQIATPGELPEHVHVRKSVYPLELPVEAGEKSFAIDDEFILPEGMPPVAKIVRFEVYPQVREQKVLSGKVVFRGGYNLCVLYLCSEGKLHTWHAEGGFSQFSDLDRDYSTAAAVNTSMLLTMAELDRDEQGKFVLKCGLCCQYVIFDRISVEVADDAYSCERSLKAHSEELALPVRLDAQTLSLPFGSVLESDAREIVDCHVNWKMPVISADEQRASVSFEGKSQVLFLDEDGLLQSAVISFNEQWSQPSDSMNKMGISVEYSQPQATLQSDGVGVAGQIQWDLSVCSARGIPMITGLELGDTKANDPERPSVILRRVGSDSIWDIAKAYSSTVEKIMDANDLTGDPLPDRMLLIPVN